MARGKKTPTKVKKLQGTYKPSESLENEMEVPKVKEIDLPPALSNEFAESEWLKVTGVLSNLDMLADTDTSILLSYCNEMGKYFAHCEVIKKYGYTFETPNGFIQARPEVKMANDALSFAIKLSDKFGFNPAARTKIEMPTKKKGDIFDDL